MIDAQATFERKPDATPPAKEPRPLFGAPEFTLVLPQARTRNGAGQTIKDLTEHPWAGVDVTMTLVARDEGNNEGRSRAAGDAAAGAAVRQAAAARADRAAPQSRARRQRQGPRADGARRADDRAGAVHAGDQHLSRAALDLLAARRAPRTTTGCATWWRGCGRWRCMLEDGNVSEIREAAAGGAGRVARGAGARRDRRRDQEADGPASRGARQVHAGAGRGDAQEPADGAAARPQPMRKLRSQDLRSMLDRMERLARSGANGRRASRCSTSCSRCSTTCRWRGPAASRATATTTCSRRSTSSAT